MSAHAECRGGYCDDCIEEGSEREYARLEGEIARLQAEVRRLTQDVREWICERCRVVYPPDKLRPGFWCVICPQCDGNTMPFPRWEVRQAEARATQAEQRVAALRKFTSHRGDCSLGKHGHPYEGVCDCGLDAALASATPEGPRRE